MNFDHYWFASGMAAEAARGIVWFSLLVFVVIGIVLYLDYKKDIDTSSRKEEHEHRNKRH